MYTRDWHPSNHSSFDIVGGPWGPHCVQGEPGAEFHERLVILDNAIIMDVGVTPESLGYSPFEDSRLEQLVKDRSIRNIYVVGIALEYCILATCLSAIECGKPVIALEPYIRAATTDMARLESRWQELTTKGVIRAHKMGECG